MSGIRVLVGTRKGAFILTSDAKRKRWDISGPQFAGWEIYHLKGSSVDPNRIYASQSSSWFGQIIQRSDDGGKTWHQPGTPAGEPVTTPDGMPKGESNKFVYDTSPETGKPLTTHQWYDGTPHPWEFKRVWHLEPSLTDSDTVYAGVEDAALFRSTDGGQNWHEVAGLRGHGSGSSWAPGAGGMCLHTILLDPSNPNRIFIAISSAGAFRTDDGGKTWKPINRGLHSLHIPNPTAEVGHCVHRIAMHRSRPGVLFMQKHWDVLRSDDAGDSWHEVSGNLPTDFGFVIEVHAHHGAQRRFRRHAVLQCAEPGIGQHRLAELRGDEHAGGDDVRTRYGAQLHQVTQRDVLIVVGARAANRRHARLQCASRVGQRRDVRMGIDKPRNHVSPAHVDDRRAGRWVEWFVLDLRDLPVPYHERRICRNRAARSVREVGVSQHHDRRRLLRGDDGRQQEQGDRKKPSVHGSFQVV